MVYGNELLAIIALQRLAVARFARQSDSPHYTILSLPQYRNGLDTNVHGSLKESKRHVPCCAPGPMLSLSILAVRSINGLQGMDGPRRLPASSRNLGRAAFLLANHARRTYVRSLGNACLTQKGKSLMIYPHLPRGEFAEGLLLSHA